MSPEDKHKYEKEKVFESKLDEMLFRIKHIFPSGDLRKMKFKKREIEQKRKMIM